MNLLSKLHAQLKWQKLSARNTRGHQASKSARLERVSCLMRFAVSLQVLVLEDDCQVVGRSPGCRRS